MPARAFALVRARGIRRAFPGCRLCSRGGGAARRARTLHAAGLPCKGGGGDARDFGARESPDRGPGSSRRRQALRGVRVGYRRRPSRRCVRLQPWSGSCRPAGCGGDPVYQWNHGQAQGCDSAALGACQPGAELRRAYGHGRRRRIRPVDGIFLRHAYTGPVPGGAGGCVMRCGARGSAPRPGETRRSLPSERRDHDLSDHACGQAVRGCGLGRKPAAGAGHRRDAGGIHVSRTSADVGILRPHGIDCAGDIHPRERAQPFQFGGPAQLQRALLYSRCRRTPCPLRRSGRSVPFRKPACGRLLGASRGDR